jgi:cytochrome c oxidase subunit II
VEKFWSILFGFVIVFCVGIFLIAPAAGWWLPPNVSSFGGEVDNLFHFILWITAFFFVLTEGLLVYSMYRFTAKPGHKAQYTHGNHRLEVMWTLVPALILVLIGFLQVGTWERIKYASRMPKPVKGVQQMEVTARQWEWRVRYPSPARVKEWDEGKADPGDFGVNPHLDDVHAANEIHVWQRRRGQTPQRVLVHLKTRDVIHSFFLPTMRLKQDALPGKTIPVWFMAEDYNTAPKSVGGATHWVDGFDPETGKWDSHERIWDLACAEFCGTRHSMMKGRLYVHKDKADFLEWLKSAEAAQNASQPAATEKK